MRRGLVVDLDNTLYNWVDFFAPSFRAMVHALARATEMDEDTLIESFRRVYRRHKSVEYAFAIQELDIWQSLDWSKERIEKEAVRAGRGAFRRTRSKRLSLYPNVRETLTWANHTESLIIIGLSDAPVFQAEMRLRSFQIDHLFTVLRSWEGSELPEQLPTDVEAMMHDGKYRSKIVSSEGLPMADLKPAPWVLKAILDEYELDAAHTYLVGDSLEKDIALAQAVGVIDIWARYGKVVSEQSIATLVRITHWDSDQIDRSEKAHLVITPTYVIDDFSQIKNIIAPMQLSFDF